MKKLILLLMVGSLFAQSEESFNPDSLIENNLKKVRYPLVYSIEIFHAPLIDYFQDLLIDPDYEHIKKNIAFGIGKKLNKKLFLSIGISLNAQDSSHFLKKSEHQLYNTFHINENTLTGSRDNWNRKRFIISTNALYYLRKSESKFWNPIGFLSASINYTKIDNFTHNLSDNITEMTFGVGLLNKVEINKLFSLIFGLTTVNTPEHILNEKGNIETIDRNGLMMPAFSLLIHPL